jgi:hypothetical protein
MSRFIGSAPTSIITRLPYAEMIAMLNGAKLAVRAKPDGGSDK